MGILVYEPAFYFYMRVPDGFDLKGNTFLEDGTPEYLEWVPLDTDKVIYPDRLIAGVHWATDIVGSVFLSSGLFMIYRFMAEYIRPKKKHLTSEA